MKSPAKKRGLGGLLSKRTYKMTHNTVRICVRGWPSIFQISVPTIFNCSNWYSYASASITNTIRKFINALSFMESGKSHIIIGAI